MSLLDTLLESLLGESQFSEFLFDKPKTRTFLEGSTPTTQSSSQDAGQGNVFVLKENPNGGFTRLKRPESNPFTAGEESVGFEQFFPQTQSQQPDVLANVKQGGFNILNKLGAITGFGSPYWAQGLDVDLQKGQPVPAPMSGEVTFVGPRGGFGNQVRVQGDDGREYWLSHLDRPDVKIGQRIGAGQVIGLGGNTGNVIKGPGGDGSHLDLTVREGGQYLPTRKIADLLKSFG